MQKIQAPKKPKIKILKLFDQKIVALKANRVLNNLIISFLTYKSFGCTVIFW